MQITIDTNQTSTKTIPYTHKRIRTDHTKLPISYKSSAASLETQKETIVRDPLKKSDVKLVMRRKNVLDIIVIRSGPFDIVIIITRKFLIQAEFKW